MDSDRLVVAGVKLQRPKVAAEFRLGYRPVLDLPEMLEWVIAYERERGKQVSAGVVLFTWGARTGGRAPAA